MPKRKRSCLECQDAHTSCGGGEPCARCLKKGLVCVFDLPRHIDAAFRADAASSLLKLAAEEAPAAAEERGKEVAPTESTVSVLKISAPEPLFRPVDAGAKSVERPVQAALDVLLNLSTRKDVSETVLMQMISLTREVQAAEDIHQSALSALALSNGQCTPLPRLLPSVPGLHEWLSREQALQLISTGRPGAHFRHVNGQLLVLALYPCLRRLTAIANRADLQPPFEARELYGAAKRAFIDAFFARLSNETLANGDYFSLFRYGFHYVGELLPNNTLVVRYIVRNQRLEESSLWVFDRVVLFDEDPAAASTAASASTSPGQTEEEPSTSSTTTGSKQPAVESSRPNLAGPSIPVSAGGVDPTFLLKPQGIDYSSNELMLDFCIPQPNLSSSSQWEF